MSDAIQPGSLLAARLRALTPARVGLGRTGVSQRTADLLAFQRAHAQARDAVHARLDAPTLAARLTAIAGTRPIQLHSAATERKTYLTRPDLGRSLSTASRALLKPGIFDLLIAVVDGLSALAVERHAPALIEQLLPLLSGWRIAPITVVQMGRVAIGDQIGAAVGAQLSVVLIGERPGLSSPDSLGAYITWNPRPGRTDAERNCISNIRAEGLNPALAARQLAALLCAARGRQLTGVSLKQLSNLIGED